MFAKFEQRERLATSRHHDTNPADAEDDDDDADDADDADEIPIYACVFVCGVCADSADPGCLSSPNSEPNPVYAHSVSRNDALV